MTPFQQDLPLSDADAQYHLGLRLLLGTDGPADPASALPHFLSAAEQDHDLARMAAARVLFQGDGMEVDEERASALLNAASHENLKRAQALRAQLNADLKAVQREIDGADDEDDDGPVLDLNDDPADWDEAPLTLVSKDEVALAKAVACHKNGDRAGALEWAQRARDWGNEDADELLYVLEQEG